MATTDLALSDALDAVKQLFDAESGKTAGPQVINARTIPGPAVDGSYSVHLASSTNTNRYRDNERLRLQHKLVVGFMVRMKMFNQYDSVLDGLDEEQRFIEAAGLEVDYVPVRLEYVSTTREATQTNEYLLTQITFAFEHDLGRMT